MNKTGFKTFVFSFVLALSAILFAGRVCLYTPETTKETIKIPRKNIALFFSHSHPQVISSKVEPVVATALKTPEIKSEKLKIAQISPEVPSEKVVRQQKQTMPETDVIPLMVEKKNTPLSSTINQETIPDVPLVYAGIEKMNRPIGGAQKDVIEKPEEKMQIALMENDVIPEPITQPIVVKGTRQIIKIDNVKKHREKLRQQAQMKKAVEKASFGDEDLSAEKDENIIVAHKDEPEENQVASLGDNIPLTDAEAQLDENDDQAREWQTMAEKHQDENPWVVARGSKFVKNKQILEEEFASENAQQKAESLIPERKTADKKTAKIAVQDNILIPIPQELLDEDDLVPDIDEDGTKKKSPVFKKKEKDKSFLDSLTSVFSKENKEKAIKKLKEKSGKLLKSGKDDDHPQILPTEIRLSFQPNRAEISGQTLKWIQAFAKKAADEPNVGLEIRIDGSHSFELQQKRLNLLYNILTINDVPYQKINTMFVEREPNSFVVRTVKIVNGKEPKKEDDSWKRYYQKW